MFSAASQSCITHRCVWSLLDYLCRCQVKRLLRRQGRTPKVTCSKKGGEFPSGTLLHGLSLTFFLSVLTSHFLSNAKRGRYQGHLPPSLLPASIRLGGQAHRKLSPVVPALSLLTLRRTCLADKTNHPVKRYERDESQ